MRTLRRTQVREVAESDRQRIAVTGYADAQQVAVGGTGSGGDRWHAAVTAVEPMCAASEVRGGLRRTADAAQLGDHVRWRRQLSQSACVIAAVTESWPQPAHNVDMPPS